MGSIHKLPGAHRTPDEIDEQLTARLADIEAQVASAAIQFPCSKCRFRHPIYDHRCTNALITGLDKVYQPNWDWRVGMGHGYEGEPIPNSNGWYSALCGPEKALWEPHPPKLSWWQRLLNWLANPPQEENNG